MNTLPKSFKRFFWDTELSKVDTKKHQVYIIERLLEYGDLEAYKWLIKNFAKSKIKTVAAKSRRISPMTGKFWQAIIWTVNLNAISKSTKRALEKLNSSPFFAETSAYLAGGTALALHLGHRYSEDLDFFTPKAFLTKSQIQLLSQIGDFKLNQTGWGTILGEFESTKFSLFYYQYKLIGKPELILKNTNLASLADIAAMKIAAIADRGTKRDFIDLFFLTKIFSLEKILAYYDQKYEKLQANKTHILRSLFYFTEAENEAPPRMIQSVDWQELKKFFEKEVKKISQDLITKP